MRIGKVSCHTSLDVSTIGKPFVAGEVYYCQIRDNDFLIWDERSGNTLILEKQNFYNNFTTILGGDFEEQVLKVLYPTIKKEKTKEKLNQLLILKSNKNVTRS